MKEGNGKRSRTQGEERTTEDIEREGKAVYVEVCNILQSCHEHHGVEPGTEAEVYRIEIHVPLNPGMLVPWTLVVGGFTCLLHVPSLPWNDSDICSSSTGSRFVVVSMTALRCSRFPKRTSVPSVGTVSPTRSQEGLSKRAFFERCFGRDGMGAGSGRGHTRCLGSREGLPEVLRI